MQNSTNNAAATTERLPRSTNSWCPPAKHLAYASDMLRLREQRTAERARRTGGAK